MKEQETNPVVSYSKFYHVLNLAQEDTKNTFDIWPFLQKQKMSRTTPPYINKTTHASSINMHAETDWAVIVESFKNTLFKYLGKRNIINLFLSYNEM